MNTFGDTVIQMFCFIYAIFALATKMLTFEVSYIYTLYKARGLKLATLTNWDLIFHILLSECV